MNSYPLRNALAVAVEYLQHIGVVVDDALIGAVKTQGFYDRKIGELTKDLYRGFISEGDFVDDLFVLMDEQLSKAWREGMRENGLDPAKDMKPEYEQQLERIKLNEVDHIEDFAAAITLAAEQDAADETPGARLPGLRARGGLWSERYQEVVNEAILATSDPGDRLVWRLGATEEHCATCAALDGFVQTADWWDKFGVFPQNPPNPALECGGWRCDCKLEPTDEPITGDQPPL